MGSLIVIAVTFALLWFLFIRPQQRRVREHNALVASIQAGDEVVLSAGIYGRILELGPEDMTLEVAPGVVLRVARQAVLRRVEDARAAGPEDALGGAGDNGEAVDDDGDDRGDAPGDGSGPGGTPDSPGASGSGGTPDSPGASGSGGVG